MVEPESVVVVPEPVISPIDEQKEDDMWGSFAMSAKDKKKAKKAGKELKPVEEPVVVVPEPPAPAVTAVDEFDTWGTATKKVSTLAMCLIFQCVS